MPTSEWGPLSTPHPEITPITMSRKQNLRSNCQRCEIEGGIYCDVDVTSKSRRQMANCGHLQRDGIHLDPPPVYHRGQLAVELPHVHDDGRLSLLHRGRRGYLSARVPRSAARHRVARLARVSLQTLAGLAPAVLVLRYHHRLVARGMDIGVALLTHTHTRVKLFEIKLQLQST